MSGYGKRRSSPEAPEEPSAKRQRLEGASTNEQLTIASHEANIAQPQPVIHPQATPSSQPVLQPQPIFQPQSIHGVQFPTAEPDVEETNTDPGSEDDTLPEDEAGPSISSRAKGKRRASSPAAEEPDAKRGASARSQKRAIMKRPGKDDKEKGEAEEVGGQLFWRDPQTGELRKAVYHNDIRAELIAAASVHGSYAHERRRGTRAHDETSFHPDQRDWSPQRQHWPRIRDNVLNMHTKANYKGTYHRKPVEGIWLHTDGRIILDKDNHPVRKFPDLPATLSSEVEGWYLEVLSRLDNRILRRDFWARLPHGRDKVGTKPATDDIFGLSALGNRRGRWRINEGLISWRSRIGSSKLNNFLKSTIAQESLDRNSNEGGRTLTADEAKYATCINEGKKIHENKGRGRTPASKKATTEEGLEGSPTPQPQSGQYLLLGQPDPTSPSLASQSRPLSTLLAGIERAREEETFDPTLNNSGIDASNPFEYDPDDLLNYQNPFQPWGSSQSGAEPSGDTFNNDLLGFEPVTDNDVQDLGHLNWDEEQQQWLDSLTYGDWNLNGLDTVTGADATGQDAWDNTTFNRNGHQEWYQPDHRDAAESAKQAKYQMLQQSQRLVDDFDGRTGMSRGASQFFGPGLDNQQRISASTEDSLYPTTGSNNIQPVPFVPAHIGNVGMQPGASPSLQFMHDDRNPAIHSEMPTPSAASHATGEFVSSQVDHNNFRDLIEHNTRFAETTSGSSVHQESEAQQHGELLTALCDFLGYPQTGEQTTSEPNSTTPISSQPEARSALLPPHPTPNSSPPPARSNQPTSSNTTTPPSSDPAPTTPIEPCHTIPTTRLQHAVLWKLLQPTREAFKAHFRDDAWRAYVPRDFVPTADGPRSYMGMLENLSGEFWRIWTARYGFDREVPPLTPPRVIDEAAARVLGGGQQGGER